MTTQTLRRQTTAIPALSVTKPRPGQPLAYLANGLIGLRVGAIPFPDGSALVGGYVGFAADRGTEGLNDAPYPLGFDIQVGGMWLSARPDLAKFVEQRLDLGSGELTSIFEIAFPGHRIRVEVLTLLSRTQPTIAMQETTIVSDREIKVTVHAVIRQESMTGHDSAWITPEKGVDGLFLCRGRGGLSTLGVACQTQFLGEGLESTRRNDFGPEREQMLRTFVVNLKPATPVRFRQMTSMVPGLMHDEPHFQASRLLGTAWMYGFDQLLRKNREAWAELWRGRPILHGADAVFQRCSDAAFFYLHSSVSPSSPTSVAPYGLSTTGYSGHVFWDCETFCFPPALLTEPETARAMLDYRFDGLPRARQNAQLNGFRGVQYPWQAANTGSEVTPFWAGGTGGIMEIHVNLDVAFAFAQYAHATGDDLFTRQKAWPVLEGVAQWIASRAEKTARGWEIRHVTGIDEFVDNIHNNSFTNMAAIVLLREAIGMAKRLGLTPPKIWGEVANGMFIPVDPATGVILKHDTYKYDGGILVPETLAGFFPFGYSHSPAADEATVRYHIAHARTFLGMPMLSSLMGVFAARAGERELSLEFFDKGVASHLVDPFDQFNETSRAFTEQHGPMYGAPDSTLFLTNPAGYLMAILMGLTGMQLDSSEPSGWFRHKVILPEGWDAIEVERLWVRGEPQRLLAEHGAEHARWTGDRS